MGWRAPQGLEREGGGGWNRAGQSHTANCTMLVYRDFGVGFDGEGVRGSGLGLEWMVMIYCGRVAWWERAGAPEG